MACRKRRILLVLIASIASTSLSRLPEAPTHSHASSMAHLRGKEQLNTPKQKQQFCRVRITPLATALSLIIFLEPESAWCDVVKSRGDQP